MVPNLDGYRDLRLLRTSSHASVYTGVRAGDRRQIVAKVYTLGSGTGGADGSEHGVETRVEHEFRLLERLDSPRVVKVLALERAGPDLVLILERHEGINLERYCDGQPMDIDAFLDVGRQIAEILAEVHEQRVIHRDVKPTNILIEPSSRAVVLADFGISALLEGQRARINDPEVIESTLPYVSPEQTGRTHTSVDFRSDLYSLGVTFYELLTGRLPFRAESSLELLHAHLARRPVAPQQLRADIPTPLSQLIMKLLEKAPERRYQSAAGVAADLARLAAARARHEPLDGFELGSDDVSMTLALPHQLYGREHEREGLLDAFRRASLGAPGVVVIRGPAGVGKSALLDALIEPVLGRRGFIARGKFDHGNEQPFSAVIAALSGLADQLLIETDARLELWRTRLREGLGGLAGVLVELVPKLGPVLGELEDDVRDYGAVKARHRVTLAFSRLLAALAKPEHPLVLALDDLQWIDPASCAVLHGLFNVSDLALLLVGTMRDGELEPGVGVGRDSLRELLANFELRGLGPEYLTLGPLDRGSLTQLVADVLGRPPHAVEPLASIVARKTGSNPFFVRQFLVGLVELGLLRPTVSGWVWDLDALDAAQLPEDSLDMMTAKLGRLDEQARRLLTTASVIGGRFDAELLAAVAPASAGMGVRAQLQRLVDEGLVANDGGAFVFGHDRVREAAYGLSSDDDKRELHARVGRHLRAALDDAAPRERVFELADHLDRGHGLLPLADLQGTGASLSLRSLDAGFEQDELEELVEVNLEAGTRALETGASRAATRYLELAAMLHERLDDQRDDRRDDQRDDRRDDRGTLLVHAIELALAQALGLSGEYARADELMDTVLARPLEPLAFAEATTQRCLLMVLAGDRERALAEGLAALRTLGESIPPTPSGARLGRAIASLAWNLRPSRLAALEAGPSIETPELLAAMELFVALRNIAYVVKPEVWVVLIARQVALFARHGTHPSMPLVLTQAGLVLANVRGNRLRAVELAEHCLALDERLGKNPRRHELLLLRQFVALWLAPWREQIEALQRVGRLAHEAGDFENATFAGIMEISLSFYGGVSLRAVEAEVELIASQVQRWGTYELFGSGRLTREHCRRLMRGPIPDSGLELFDATDAIPTGASPETAELSASDARLMCGLLAYLFGHHRDALELLQACAPTLERMMPGTWLIPVVRVLEPLAAAAYLQADDAVGAAERRRLRRLVRERARQLTKLSAEGCNFAHLAALLRAEVHALDGELERAGVELERARELAAAQQHTMFEAIAYERMAALAERRGLSSWVTGPALAARERYAHWGAAAKVTQLERRWPQLLDERAGERASDSSSGGRVMPRPSSSSGAWGSSSSSSSSMALDMATIFKTWDAISTDIRLDEVVDRVMQIAIENAGADRGALVLATDDGLELIAELELDGQTHARVGRGLSLPELGDRLPIMLLRWVARTREAVVLAEASEDLRFVSDPYVRGGGVRSILCLPIVKHERLIGLLYLENKLNPRGFTRARLETMQLLMGHAAGALENARLYEALRASELRWRLLVDRLPDVVALLDRAGVVEVINHPPDPAQRRQLLGRPLLELARGARSEALGAALTRVCGAASADAATGRELEVELELPGTGPRWYATRLVPIVVDGRLERVIAVATDTTERRQRAREKAELEAQLRHQQKLESIGTLAAGVAHEINNPMQGIMNYAELIASSEQAGPVVREFAGEIDHESKRVATIVRNLLAFSRQERDQAAVEVTVESIAEDTLSLIHAVLRKDQITLELGIQPGLPRVRCRSQQIQQVIMNLVANARDALNARFSDYHADKRIDLRAASFMRDGARWVRIDVEDRGGGVPEALVGEIFDPFFTTKDRDHGTGLGLSVSHGIIADHGGALRLSNRPGEGACFHIEVPALGRRGLR